MSSLGWVTTWTSFWHPSITGRL